MDRRETGTAGFAVLPSGLNLRSTSMPVSIRKQPVATAITSIAARPASTQDIAPRADSKPPSRHQSNRRHSQRLPIDFDLDRPQHIRIGHWLQALQISHSKFYSDLRAKKIPPAEGHDGRPWWHAAALL